MYSSKSINDGIEFISQSNYRTNETLNKVKKNRYKTSNNSKLVLETDITEGFEVNEYPVNRINAIQTNEMNNNINSYDNTINTLQSSIVDITTQSKTFLDLKNKSQLKNKDIETSAGSYGRVNNSGIFKYYPSKEGNRCGTPATPVITGINPSNVSRTSMNPFPLLKDPGNSANIALFGSNMAVGPNGKFPCDEYAGTNIYVSKPISFPYDTHSTYAGAFLNNSSSPDLVQQNDMSGSNQVTVKQCITRAMDRGYSVAALNNFNPSSKKGDCYIGNGTIMNGNDPNHFKIITDPAVIFQSTSGSTHVTFAADGGFYRGSAANKYETSIMPSGSNVPISDLHPQYGGTISYITASYAYDRGWQNWDDLLRFNYSPIGSPGGRLDTARQNTYWIPVLKTRSYTDYYGNNISYQQWEWETTTVTSTVAPSVSGSVYINYTCGKKNVPPTSEGGVQVGQGFNISCWDLYNKYPYFSMSLSDNGIITIRNNSSDTTTQGVKWTSSNTPISVPLLTLSNGRQIDLRAPRRDWVSESINRGGDIVSYSNYTPTMTDNTWISSPNGLCRLIFKSNVNKLVLEYSLYDVELDKNKDVIGVGRGFSKYNLTSSDGRSTIVDLPSIKGKVGYIDIDNGLHEYTDASMLGFDSSYTPMVGFLPSGSASKLTSTSLDTELKCSATCTDAPTCAGYTYINGVCNTYTDTEIFPKGDRIMMLNDDGVTMNESLKTQIRNKKIASSHYSCNKVVNNVDSTTYRSYPTTSNMRMNQKCALGLIIDAQLADLEQKKIAAASKGNEIREKISKVYDNQTKLNNLINTKSSEIVKGLEKQKEEKIKIDKYVESNNTSNATVTDTELLLISDNYRYMMWGFATIIVSMVAIKTFRNASL